jgi:hypothetical protein
MSNARASEDGASPACGPTVSLQPVPYPPHNGLQLCTTGTVTTKILQSTYDRLLASLLCGVHSAGAVRMRTMCLAGARPVRSGGRNDIGGVNRDMQACGRFDFSLWAHLTSMQSEPGGQ